MKTSWAEPSSRFTLSFEALVIDWIEVAPISKVAERLGLGWSVVDGIIQRAGDRGLTAKPRRSRKDSASMGPSRPYVAGQQAVLPSCEQQKDPARTDAPDLESGVGKS